MWGKYLRLKSWFNYYLFMHRLRLRWHSVLPIISLITGLLLLRLNPIATLVCGILTALGIIGEITSLVIGYWKVERSQKELYFSLLSPDSLSKLGKSDKYRDFRFMSFQGHRALYSDNLNRFITDSTLSFKMRSKRFKIPEKAKNFSGFVLQEIRRTGVFLFNDAKIRLASDPLPLDSLGTKELLLEKTDYFSGVCTNMVTAKEIRARTSKISLCDGFEFMSNRNIILDLEESYYSNHIGVNALAITTDGFLVLINQTIQSARSPGKLAPSGSGSLDSVY